MSAGPPRTPDDPVPDDPFRAEDPAAAERERRRQERERRRQEHERRHREHQLRREEAEPPAVPPTAARATEEPDPPARAAWAGESPLARLPRPRSPRGWALVLGAAVVLWLLIALFQPFHGDGEGQQVVMIPEGAGVGEIAELLDEKGVISSATLFELRLTLAGRRSDIAAGTYALAGDMSYSAAIDELTKPPSERTVTVTIPEGYSGEQIAALATETGLSGDYERASRSSPKLDPADYGGPESGSLEGFLFPATYELKPGGDVEDLVGRQLDAFKENIRQVNTRYARSRGLTTYDLLTIASLIEREVMVPKERRLVAAVIYNRLADGEPLAIDATIRYATGNFTEPLTEADKRIDSPYNTYTNAGLPPGPIGNPGLDSIEAAANPARVDYRFYVVKPGTCGEHTFSTTLTEHEQAVAEYNAAREEAGGRAPTEC